MTLVLECSRLTGSSIPDNSLVYFQGYSHDNSDIRLGEHQALILHLSTKSLEFSSMHALILVLILTLSLLFIHLSQLASNQINIFSQTHAHQVKDPTMCYQIIERYAVCRCLYHRHSVDPCQRYGQQGHGTTEKTVLVGFTCPDHAAKRRPEASSGDKKPPSGARPWRDSGYSSAGYHSGSSRR